MYVLYLAPPPAPRPFNCTKISIPYDRVKIEKSFNLYFHPGLCQHIIFIITIYIIVYNLIQAKINYSILFYDIIKIWNHNQIDVSINIKIKQKFSTIE